MELCALASGSKANCYYIKANKTEILVDNGLSIADAECRLKKVGKNPQNIQAIFLTHEHRDHVAGVVAFCAKYGALLFVHKMALNSISYFAQKIKDKIRVFDSADFYFNELTISPFLVSHDAAYPVGFSFYFLGKKVTIMIDTGIVTSDMLNAVLGSNAIVLEANHDEHMLLTGPYPAQLKRRIKSENGHLSNRAAAEVAKVLVQSGTSIIVLGHLSEKNNFPEIAMAEVQNATEGKCQIYVANQYEPTQIFTI